MHNYPSDIQILSSDTAKLQAELYRHNTEWQKHFEKASQFISAPIWAQNDSYQYCQKGIADTFLPCAEFALSLRRIARIFFKDNSFIPSLLCSECDHCNLMKRAYSLDSIFDFWHILPGSLAGKIQYSEEDLLPLFCALADPPRYGTAPNRYPEQMRLFHELADDFLKANSSIRVLDLGCGIGLGTLELANSLEKKTKNYDVQGLTLEPLEVWMATNRFLPHDAVRQKYFQQFSCDLSCSFQVGDAKNFELESSFDFIFCNGLAGGRFLHKPCELQRFLDCIDRHLNNGGYCFMANCFHDGFRATTELLIILAKQKGFWIHGTWRNLLLQKLQE
ncbi:MAG: class I SAM-dependent methyltransferase [Lentisphaeria bacterium]